MTALPWMLARLAAETRGHVGASDDDRLRSLDSTTVGEYCSFLARIAGFETVVEAAVGRMTEIPATFIEDHARSHLLRADLRNAVCPDPEHSRITMATNVVLLSPAHALGWMYVLARHTLLAGLLRRQFDRVLGPRITGATRYLDVSSERAGTRFAAFGVQLGELTHRFPARHVIDGANDAFRAQRQWYATRERIVARRGSIDASFARSA